MKKYDIVITWVSLIIALVCMLYYILIKNYIAAIGFFMAVSANTTILRILYRPYK
jgi:hypothetical protein